ERLVGGRVVDDDRLIGRAGLAGERIEARRQQVRAVVGGHDHADGEPAGHWTAGGGAGGEVSAGSSCSRKMIQVHSQASTTVAVARKSCWRSVSPAPRLKSARTISIPAASASQAARNGWRAPAARIQRSRPASQRRSHRAREGRSTSFTVQALLEPTTPPTLFPTTSLGRPGRMVYFCVAPRWRNWQTR